MIKKSHFLEELKMTPLKVLKKHMCKGIGSIPIFFVGIDL